MKKTKTHYFKRKTKPKEKLDGFNLRSGWQTVDWSLAELENSWSVFGNNGKQLGNDGLANSWSIIGILLDDNN